MRHGMQHARTHARNAVGTVMSSSETHYGGRWEYVPRPRSGEPWSGRGLVAVTVARRGEAGRQSS